VEQAIPNFREIDRDPRWHRWLLGVDALTGKPRQTLLNDAISKGSAARAIEFFRRFQQEEAGGTSQTYSVPYQRRTRSYDKPIYTRDQIAKLYDQHLIPDCGDTDSSAARSALEHGAYIPLDHRTFLQ
jgi:hypothetical protein